LARGAHFASTIVTQEVQYFTFTNYTEQPQYSIIEQSGCNLPTSQVGIRWQLPMLNWLDLFNTSLPNSKVALALESKLCTQTL
jgi:hypothetical protein